MLRRPMIEGMTLGAFWGRRDEDVPNAPSSPPPLNPYETPQHPNVRGGDDSSREG